MVECTGLENRRTERYRGFESLSLRNVVTLSSDLLFSLRAPQSQTPYGEMAEWSNAPVLKTGVLRGIGGSNPSLSAIKEVRNDFLFFVYLTTKRVVYQGKSIYLHRISFISKGQ